MTMTHTRVQAVDVANHSWANYFMCAYKVGIKARCYVGVAFVECIHG